MLVSFQERRSSGVRRAASAFLVVAVALAGCESGSSASTSLFGIGGLKHLATIDAARDVEVVPGRSEVLLIEGATAGKAAVSLVDAAGSRHASVALPGVEYVESGVETDSGWVLQTAPCFDPASDTVASCDGRWDLTVLDRELAVVRTTRLPRSMELTSAAGDFAYLGGRQGRTEGTFRFALDGKSDPEVVWTRKTNGPESQTGSGSPAGTVPPATPPAEPAVNTCMAGSTLYTWEWDDGKVPSARLTQIDGETGRTLATVELAVSAARANAALCSPAKAGDVAKSHRRVGGGDGVDVVTVDFGRTDAAGKPTIRTAGLPFNDSSDSPSSSPTIGQGLSIQTLSGRAPAPTFSPTDPTDDSHTVTTMTTPPVDAIWFDLDGESGKMVDIPLLAHLYSTGDGRRVVVTKAGGTGVRLEVLAR